MAKMLLDELLCAIDFGRRQTVLRAFVQPDSSLGADAEFQFLVRLFRMLTPQQQEQLLCHYTMKKLPAVQG